MKKYLYIALAAAALTSCSSDEVMETVEKQAIAFGNPFIENSTRATDNTYGAVALTKFDVYGTVQGTGATTKVNIFDGDLVEGEVGADEWSCDVKQYWIANSDYDFAAVVEYNKEGSKVAGNTITLDSNKMPQSYLYNTSTQVDLLYDENLAPTIGSAVNFTFDHLLSKAWFTVKSNARDGYTHTVKNITVSNYATANYYFQTVGEKVAGNWYGATEGNISFEDIVDVTSKETKGKTNATQMLLIPNNNDFTVSFTIDLELDGKTVESIPYTKTVSQDLLKGNSYNFTLDLTVGGLIEFTVTDAPAWAGPTSITL